MKRSELARALGVPYSSIAEIENEEQVASKHSEALAKALRVHHTWLVSGKGPKELPAQDEDGEFRDIKAWKQPIGLGNPAEAADEYAETHRLKFRADSLARKHLTAASLGVCYGKGDSMQPRIKSGDAILFNRDEHNPVDEVLFVIVCAGVSGNEYNAKKCRIFGKEVFFEALNPSGDHLMAKGSSDA